jgi:hypothetical protein
MNAALEVARAYHRACNERRFLLYDMSLPFGTMRVAEHFTVRDAVVPAGATQ